MGSGQYAVVYPGSIQHPISGEKIQVAIKTIRSNSGDEYLRALLKEIKTMAYVGEHPHIVKLIGCYTQDLQNGCLFRLYNIIKRIDLLMVLNRIVGYYGTLWTWKYG